MQLTPASPKPAAEPLRLAHSLDITSAEALLGALQARIAHDAAVLIDGRDVERVSTPCLQLLVAAAARARQHGLSFRIEAPSAVLRTAIEDLGLSGALGMHAVSMETA